MHPILYVRQGVIPVVSGLPQPTAPIRHCINPARHALHERATEERSNASVIRQILFGDRGHYRVAAERGSKRLLNFGTVREGQRAIVHRHQRPFLRRQSIVQPMPAILPRRYLQLEFQSVRWESERISVALDQRGRRICGHCERCRNARRLRGRVQQCLRPRSLSDFSAARERSVRDDAKFCGRAVTSSRWVALEVRQAARIDPIDAPARLSEAGFEIAKCVDLEIWTMPVCAVPAIKPDR